MIKENPQNFGQRSKGEGTYIKYLAKRFRIGIFNLVMIQILTLVNTVINFPVPQTPGLSQRILSADHLYGLCYTPAHTKTYTIIETIKTLHLIHYFLTIILESPKILCLVLFKMRSETSRTFPGSIPGGVNRFFSDKFLPTVPWPWGRLSP